MTVLNALFAIGEEVQLKSTPSTHGVVTDCRFHGNAHEYHIFVDGRKSWYIESDLCTVQQERVWRKRDDFLREMLLLKLAQPFSNSLYAYRASRTEFAAYQFRPILKFLNNPEQRILIADEVGLGKTIEASMIYLELKARLNISQVLIVCPSRLREKWKNELANRFGEDFQILGRDQFRQLLDHYERTDGAYPFRAILSYEMIRQASISEQMVRARMRLDLVIADEAHHLRNRETATNHAVELITQSADAVVFLTATPLHLGSEDLFNLLHLLSPGTYYDRHTFPRLVEPNRYINEAVRLLASGEDQKALTTLKRVEETLLARQFHDNPIYASVKQRLEAQISDQREHSYPIWQRFMRERKSEAQISDRRERVQLQRDLMELNTFSQIFTRTRKREVAQAAVRSASSIIITLTPLEQTFYEAVLDHVREELRRVHFGAISFAIVTKERMAASCLGAVREKYLHMSHTRKVRFEHQPSWYDEVYTEDGADEDEDQEYFELDGSVSLSDLARQMGTTDSKFERLVEILDEIMAEEGTKVLLFSTFRDTLNYLYERLSHRDYGLGRIHGGIAIVERQRIIEDFRTDPGFRLLLSSEVGSEGLDFQFCGVLINYDLPWNPMKVEQRIGRLDRFGQQHERIRIYNFYIENTIETRILQRLYDRIGIFKEMIGELEAILGNEIRNLSRQVLQQNLTPEEEERLAEETANQIARRYKEQEALDARRDEFLGQDAILNAEVNAAIDSGRIIHPDEVRAVVQTYLKKAGIAGVEFVCDPDEPTWTLYISPQLAAVLRQHEEDNRRKKLIRSEAFQTAMTHHRQIALTFDSDYARKRPLLEFITFNHLLADIAITYWKTERTGLPVLRGVEVRGPSTETGEGFFFVYSLDQQALHVRRTLITIIVLDDGQIAETASTNLLGHIQQDDAIVDLDQKKDLFDQAQRIADTWIASKRDERRHVLGQQNDALIAARKAAIEQSFQVKLQRVEEVRQKVKDERLLRMYEGQIRNLRADLQSKLDQAEQGRRISVSYELVAAGRVRVLDDGSS